MQLHMQADGMKPKISVLLILIILGLNCFTSVVFLERCKATDPPTFYVDDDNTEGPWDGSSAHPFYYIQDAIRAVENNSGYRIQVLAGDYTENIVIRSNKTSLDLFGEDKTITTITGNGSGDVITVSATDVDISGFTIKDVGTSSTSATLKINANDCVIVDNIISDSKYGCYIENSSNTKIYYNEIKNILEDCIYIGNSDYNNITYTTITGKTSGTPTNNNGIFLYNCSWNNIAYSTITKNGKNGIYLNSTCDNNTLENNYVSDNEMNGIYLNDHCENNTISYHNGNNKIYSNSDSGIRLENSSTNILKYNSIVSNIDYGIMVLGTNNFIHNSTITGNSITKHGIFLFGDDNSIVENNSVRGNTDNGIRVQNSTNSEIRTNNITSNSIYGVYINYYAVGNKIYNNYFYDNSKNAYDMSEETNNNLWFYNTTGYNIINGANKNISGNYWDDYDNASEGASDSNDDGFADQAYSFNISNTDNKPILDTISPEIGTPSANPSTQTIGGYTYISATITDNLRIEEVRLVVIDPNGDSSNISITEYKSGDTYYYNYLGSVVGDDYSYKIQARDARNWKNSATGSFEIDEGTAPTITDNSPSTGSPNSIYTFNVTVTDDSDSSSEITVKAAWSQDDKSGNYTLLNVYEDYFEIGVDIGKSTESLIYTIYAYDQWGNPSSTQSTTVKIIDNTPPTISIEDYGPSSEELLNSYTFGATITDDVSVNEVTIEYWYENSDAITVEMDQKTSNYYEKVIIIDNQPERVYCVFYATDPSGNQADTKNPIIDTGGGYKGAVSKEVTFDASSCYDLDGNITDYLWDFGDGTTGSGETTTHTYSANGNYTITLTVTDNDGNTNSETTYANIVPLTQQKTTYEIMNYLENEYNINLTDLFYSYDTDGDSLSDTFIDPNNVLTPVHSEQIEIDEKSVFLLSIDGGDIPEFIWDSNSNEIISITYVEGIISNTNVDESNGLATSNVIVNKSNGWIYLEVVDPDIEDYGSISDIVNVLKNDVQIDEDKIIRKDTKTYILDDPEVDYQFVYSYTSLTLGYPSFSPSQGSTINKDNPTISFTYNIAVDDITAIFYSLKNDYVTTLWEADITKDLDTMDWKTFTYTPPDNLPDGLYYLEITAYDSYGNPVNSETSYNYESYATVKAETSIIPSLIMLGAIIGIGLAIFLILKYKNITFESFIYYKNRKIIPFFKPIVIGPLRIDVNDNKVKKAEFYVNGILKQTITEKPYTWMWDEKAFMKKNIETKVMDEEGNIKSSGEMTFYMFNPPKFFK